MNKNEYTRQEFYDLIWTKSLSNLSKEWDIKYTVLKAICDKYNIPTPNNGYWSKLKFGKPTLKSKLPERDNQIVIEIDKLRATKPKTGNKPIKIPKKLDDTDPVIKATIEHYIHNEYSLLHPQPKDPIFLKITVQPQNLQRAFRIAGALVTALRLSGYTFERKNHYICLVKDGISIPFHIWEKRRRKLIPNNRGSLTANDTYTGLLSIKVRLDYDWEEIAETKEKPFEKYLSKVLLFLDRKVIQMTEHKKELQQYWAEQREEAWKLKEIKDRKNKELSDFKNLFSLSECFYKAQHIREYIDKVEKRAIEQNNLTDQLKEWLQWARDKADWYDPFIEKEDELLDGVDRNFTYIHFINK